MSLPKSSSMNVYPNNTNALEQQPLQQRQITFPLPPMSYVNKYTNNAVANGTAPAPPPLPHSSAIYTMFSDPFYKDDHVVRSLESQGQRRLYPQVYDPKKELKKLNISAVANFLDLLQIISHEPGSLKRQEKIDHILIIFINMHHLLNEYRPHQARDTLREIMKSQIESAIKTNESANNFNKKSDDLLFKLRSELNEYLTTQKSASTVLSECGLLNLLDVDVEMAPIDSDRSDVNRKRKFEEDEQNFNCESVTIKKEATQPANVKQSVLLSDKVRDGSLWQQLFNEMDE